MLGIIVQLALSWLIIWLFERKHLGVLGFYPTKRRLLDFALFFLLTAALCSTEFLMKIFIAGQDWQVNHELTPKLVLKGLWWNIKSVLFEELIFRGVLLYILIKRLGAAWGIIISAIGFGIYHWFSLGALGNPGQMAVVFIITGTMGLVYAYGYAKTFSLYVPCAIHLGWNFTHNFIFSTGPIGNGIFIPVNDEPFTTDSWALYMCILVLPLLLTILLNFWLLKKHKQALPG